MSADATGGLASAPAYQERIARLHRELGIAADYAAARAMRLFSEATGLVAADHDPDGAEILLASDAAGPWAALKAAAREDGVILLAYSGFRSVERQVRIIRTKREAGQPLESILHLVAAPGFSEHHTGRAIDIGTLFEPPLEEAFAQTSAYLWLSQHAGHFGFTLSYPRGNTHGIGYEPWHWCWNS